MFVSISHAGGVASHLPSTAPRVVASPTRIEVCCGVRQKGESAGCESKRTRARMMGSHERNRKTDPANKTHNKRRNDRRASTCGGGVKMEPYRRERGRRRCWEEARAAERYGTSTTPRRQETTYRDAGRRVPRYLQESCRCGSSATGCRRARSGRRVIVNGDKHARVDGSC